VAEEPHVNGVLASLPDKLIRVLPPAMVLLITLNVIFLGTLLYLVESNAEYRNQILTKIVENCLVRDNRQ
jgi:hypothetical protein